MSAEQTEKQITKFADFTAKRLNSEEVVSMGELCPNAQAIMVSDLPARKDEITVRLYQHIQGLNDIYSEVV